MRQISLGSWKLDARRGSGARLVLQAVTGEQIYADLSLEDLSGLRGRAEAIEAEAKAKAEAEQPAAAETVETPEAEAGEAEPQA